MTTHRSMRFALSAALVACGSCLATRTALANLNIRQVAPGIYEGRAPRTAADYQQLKSLGIKTVVEMRRYKPHAIAREQQALAAYGIREYRVPMGFSPLRDGSPEQVLRLLRDPELQPIYFHCNLGRERTGLVVALYRVRYQGWSRAAAYDEMRRTRFNPLLRGMDRYFWQRSR